MPMTLHFGVDTTLRLKFYQITTMSLFFKMHKSLKPLEFVKYKSYFWNKNIHYFSIQVFKQRGTIAKARFSIVKIF